MSAGSGPDPHERNGSYKRIIRSTSITGGASIVNLVVGLLRIKFAAIVLGPTGIGLIGLLQTLMTTASTVAAMGFGTVGTRQIAEADGRRDDRGVEDARRALFWGTLILAFVGGLCVWAMRDVLAVQLFREHALRYSLGWLGLGVALTVAAGSQAALLNGLRRIGDLARVTVASAVGSAALGVAALSIWGEAGVLAFVIAAPLASFIAGHWYVARLPSSGLTGTPLRVLVGQWRALASLGVPFMITGLVGSVGHLTVRMLIQRELGADALGHFQASWMIAMTYVGFVLAAMGTDFYPRLTAIIHDSVSCGRLINEQTEVALLLAGPVLLAMLALAPWVIALLYSSEFSEAAVILRWQMLGDVLMVISWPIAFIILAAGHGRTYMLIESFSTCVFVGLIWLGLPLIGLQATGVAFIALYVVYLPLVYWQAKRRIGFSWTSPVKRQIVWLVAAALVIFATARVSNSVAAVFGSLVAVSFGVHSIRRLSVMAGHGAAERIAALSRSILTKLGL